MSYTAREKATEAKREVAQREWVYQKMVDGGRLKLDQANYRIAVMKEIAADYAELAEAEEAMERLI
jgi:hypothetical protein